MFHSSYAVLFYFKRQKEMKWSEIEQKKKKTTMTAMWYLHFVVGLDTDNFWNTYVNTICIAIERVTLVRFTLSNLFRKINSNHFWEKKRVRILCRLSLSEMNAQKITNLLDTIWDQMWVKYLTCFDTNTFTYIEIQN